jgi:hypothetical protein
MLQIAHELIQHYILDVEPRAVHAMIAALDRSGNEASAGDPKIGPWSQFFWLNRPAVWAIRPVRITTGLDAFLIKGGGLPGVVDVAEILTHALVDENGRGPIANGWTEFVSDAPAGSVLFASFLWLNWDAFAAGGSWEDGKPPLSSAVLGAFRSILGSASEELSGKLSQRIRLLLAGANGDCDTILYGFVSDIADLDQCLCMVNQQTVASVADALGTTACASVAACPVVLRSRTELAVSMDLYGEMLRTEASDRGLLVERINHALCGDLQPEVALARGGGAITSVHSRISDVVGEAWSDQPVFGRDDFLVRLASGAQGVCKLGDLLDLLARLDRATVTDAGFPRRVSLHLGFTAPCGRSKEPTPDIGPPPQAVRREPNRDLLESLDRLLLSLNALKWREELRIVERIAERCVTLQKSHALPRETRDMLSSAFECFGELCQRIEKLEAFAQADELSPASPEKTRRQAALWDEIQLLRWELHNSGASLDRVLSYHSRGVTALLLHPASQARGASHFASEIKLGIGHGVIFRAPAVRLAARVRALSGRSDDSAWGEKLASWIKRISKPIIYASHDPGFGIRPGLSLLRIPTWGLWMPTTHVLHELAHTLAIVGSLHYLARKVLARAAGGPECPCRHFEANIAALGLRVAHPGSWDMTTPLRALAQTYFLTLEPTAPGGLPTPHAGQMSDLEEIAADAVERLLGYVSGEEGDRMHLTHSLPTIVPDAVRNSPEQFSRRIFRLFAGQLAVRLAMAARQGTLQIFADDTQLVIRDLAQRHAAQFGGWLASWFQEFLSSDAAVMMSKPAVEMIRNVGRACSTASLFSCLPVYMRFSQLLAAILSLEPVTHTEIQSLFNASHVWGSLMHVASEADARAAEVAAITAQLAAGLVPSESFAFPERLIASLREAFGPGIDSTLPTHARLALSHYLGSLFWEGDPADVTVG